MQSNGKQACDERWELASWASNEGIWDWDMRTNKVYRSDRWYQMFGYQPGELPDTPWAWETLIHPDDAFRVIEQRRHHMEGLTERYCSEHRMRCKDGQYRWCYSRGTVMRDENGNPVRMLVFCADIHDSMEMRARSLHQKDALKALRDISMQAIGNDADDVTLTSILNRIRDFISADKAFLMLKDLKTDVMRTHSMSGNVGPSLMEIRKGEYLTGKVWESGECQYVKNYCDWPSRSLTSDLSQIKTALGLPLKVGRDVVGVLSVGFLSHRKIDKEEIDLLQQFASIAALVIRNRTTDIQLQEDSLKRDLLEALLQYIKKMDFFNALVDGTPISASEMELQIRRQGTLGSPGYIALVIQCNCASDQVAEAAIQLETSRGICIWRREGRLFLFCHQSFPQNDRQELTAKATELCRAMGKSLAVRIEGAGVGLYCQELKDLTTGFRQARGALELGSRLYPQLTIHHFLDIGMIQILQSKGERRIDKEQIETFIAQSIGKLIEYDRQKDGHLIDTLQVILNGQCMRCEAAELFVHPKTLQFRKRRIEEILGESLDNGSVRLNLSLALQMHEMQKDK